MEKTSPIVRIYPTGEKPHLGVLTGDGLETPCALGRAGILNGTRKKEGDSATPSGLFFPRRVYLRNDRIRKAETPLETRALGPEQGWCDDPQSPSYNRPVKFPFEESAEKMWRKDHLYDVVLVISHNDSPPVKDRGSAIFFHLAKEGFAPTEGCVALKKKDMLVLIKFLTPATLIRIHEHPL